MFSSRRAFLTSLAAAGAMTQIGKAYSSATCPFRLSVINDELTPDFGRACEIAANDFGLHWIELRSMWNKNVTELDAKEIAEVMHAAQKISAARDRHCQSAVQG